MCGIAGLISPALRDRDRLAAMAAAMTRSLAHRGPDDEGFWIDAEAGVGLGHRRLAIIDLSPRGHQPMLSPDGRYVVSYNGEIYNFRELRAELEAAGQTFQSESDTEVLLASCAAWGVVPALRRMRGIFAFALWDRAERRLALARDHFGIKPLYWAAFGDLFLFGSELKSLRAQGGWTPRIDRAALAAYLRFNYVPGPRSIYEGVRKLPPGAILTWQAGAEPRVERYWDPVETALAAPPLRLGDAAAAEALDGLLGSAVREQMVSDVPIGAFLSGGIDSSVVTALMRKTSAQPVKTFTIGFDVPGYDESGYAAAVARALGTRHVERRIGLDYVLAKVPSLAGVYDEPFGDPSELPTLLVSELARGEVTVVLSGDGGDELFGGYRRYFWGERIWRTLRPLPRPLRRAGAAALARLLPHLPSRPRHLAGRAVDALALDGAEAIYERLITHWPEDLLGGAEPDPPPALEAFPLFAPRMQMRDTLTYLPDDILTKVDRASMTVGLEARVPLLDPRVFAFAWQLAPAQRREKRILRDVLARHLPRDLFERPKMGFGAPVGAWLKGPLRDWAEGLLHASGLLDRGPVERVWRQHLAGERDWQYRLWTLLMFEAWYRDCFATTSSSAPAAPDARRGSARRPLERLP